MDDITRILEMIESQIGLKLTPCDYFTGIRSNKRGRYFNVMLNERVFLSADYLKIERFANTYKTIRVEPNGVERVAIFFNI